MIAIIDYLKDLFDGRGFFAPFLVITGWGYTIILVVVLVYYIIVLFIHWLHDL